MASFTPPLRVIWIEALYGVHGRRQPLSGPAVHPRPGSTRHVGEQPSPASWLPSSHSSLQLGSRVPSPHTIESPLHAPATHWSALVQTFPSLQLVPSGSDASGPHAAL